MDVDVVLTQLPHYRKGFAQTLEGDDRLSVRWILGSPSDPQAELAIPGADMALKRVESSRNIFLPLGLIWQTRVLGYALRSSADAVVLTGDPHIITNWLAALIYRARGVRCFMWTHGWTRVDKGAKRLLRRAFYSLTDGLLLYGERAVRLGEIHSYKGLMCVIYNSTDVAVRELSELVPRGTGGPMQRWIIVSRLAPYKEFERVLDAIAYLRLRGRKVALTVIGDGPSLEDLKKRALSLGIQVDFRGAAYGNSVDRALQESDILVSPLSVGLPAIHAMSQGCPVATSEIESEQMPESEAVQHLVNGVKFDPYSTASIAESVWDFVSSSKVEEVRARCINEVKARWTAEEQASRFAGALLELVGAE